MSLVFLFLYSQNFNLGLFENFYSERSEFWPKRIFKMMISDNFLSGVHAAVLLFSFLSPFLLSLQTISSLVFLHRLHFWAFEGCLLSKLQQKLGHFGADLSFFQHLFGKFNFKLTKKQAWWLDKYLNGYVLAISFLLWIS